MAAETPPSSAAGEEPPGKWEELLDAWTDCARATMDRATERARQNVRLAREGKYGLGAWLSDVAWFWSTVAEEASDVVNRTRDTTATRARPEQDGRR
jgi:hypothetical protein